ncbi:MAG: potassium channel family protein [Bacillus sp. (in: Bacteria)]|nr:potassium channel family protein [Bacillus sp. (in: firmicutes)]
MLETFPFVECNKKGRTYRKKQGGTYKNGQKKKVGLIILLILFIVIIGTIGYRFTEGLSIFDALWLAVVSMLTIGYGDLTPETTEGKIFTLILIPIAIALTTYLLTQLAGTIIKEKFSNEVRKKIIMKKVNKLKNHIIICGYGEVGKKVVEQLRKTDHQLVIIEEKQELVNELEGDFYAIAGDATEEVTLLQAGVKEASVIIITLPSDSDNVFMTLTVKGLNPSINVITRSKKGVYRRKSFIALEQTKLLIQMT